MTRAKTYEDISCRYFLRPGRRNTRALLEAAARRAEETGIRKALVLKVKEVIGKPASF